MSKSSSVFVVTSGYYGQVEGAYSSFEATKDAVLSDILLDVLDGDKYISRLDDLQIDEWVDGEVVNAFEVSCEGIDFGTYKVTNTNKVLQTLDISTLSLSRHGDR
jgi:hypothetical protein